MISVVILTKNSEKTIEKTIDSAIDFEEIILLDNFSTDNTLLIAKKNKKIKIIQHEIKGFGSLRNYGASLAKNSWILALDSDEVITKELKQEILNLKKNDMEIYSIPFKNYYNNKHIKGCGWHNESHTRLYNKKNTSFSESLVHEKVIEKNLSKIKLKNHIIHTSYVEIEDFLNKMNYYSTLFAKQNKNKKKSSLSKAIFHGLFAFFKSYIIKKGIFLKKEGFIISVYNANTAFYKYLKLMEYNNKCS